LDLLVDAGGHAVRSCAWFRGLFENLFQSSFRKSDAGPAGGRRHGAAVLLFLATGAFLGGLLRAALLGGFLGAAFLRGLARALLDRLAGGLLGSLACAFLRGLPGAALLRSYLRGFPGAALLRSFLRGLLGGFLHRLLGRLLHRRFLGGFLLRRLLGSRFGSGRGRRGRRRGGFFGDAPRERGFVAHRMLLRMDR